MIETVVIIGSFLAVIVFICVGIRMSMKNTSSRRGPPNPRPKPLPMPDEGVGTYRLKDGDTVKFKHPFPMFTMDKKYKVRMTRGLKSFVCDDQGVYRSLLSAGPLEARFEKEAKKCEKI
ncbi:hypothetical protein LCGC14_1035360 [marine sediment metagenome]|uniref:Uncharacterized protein n=1 Tax=marine sediment metagenome TaxID=412755 RepID=A0A0F9QZE7_9ZZZZ